jgi:cell division FtsZ-interacting protein ZapD
MLDSQQPDIRGWLNWRNKIVDHDFQWRLLHISFDGLNFLERAPAISDLLGRQTALQAALDDVRKLLEMTYPLGNEVYRDENGSAFVVPALDGDDDDGNRLRGLIERHILDALRQSELGGELQPRIHITKAHKQAAVLHQALDTPPPPVAPFQDNLRSWWQGEAADICTTCGVRPQGPSQKGKDRKVCDTCERRRADRSQLWAQARHKTGPDRKPWERTIWLDEVADQHDRLALVVGKFDLRPWLNGELIQTLLVVCDSANGVYERKNPSFARIQRVWRTTQQFWQAVQNEDIPSATQSDRLAIAVTNGDKLQNQLGDYHAYEAEVNGRRLSVVWDSCQQSLITADNLMVGTRAGAEALLAQLPDVMPLFEPGGYRLRRTELTPASIDKGRSQVIPATYTPAIDLLTQPASFMALAPARHALVVATKISQRYELEMSKVRNRLPLFLGLVFFDRRQPLFSALDAGRRMLDHPLAATECTVTSSCACSRHDGDRTPAHLAHPHFEQWQEIELATAQGDSCHWRASTVMGDGRTQDEWYPYVQVRQDKDGNRPTGRQHFEQPENSGQHWVHVSQVQNGDTVCFTPAYFSWLHLDTSARRFEAGEEVFVLEELNRTTALWKKLQELAEANQLSESQLHAIVTLLTTKEQSWGASSNEYRQLAETILNTEGLAEGSDPVTVDDLTSGRLQRTFELYHRILKQRL